ncbi:hypothetical protein [uncultured Eubacterium sp.]|uniref:hypothetical protein n=1 Tax=uncultured Eubacterium sp. TaxID=165185 RepID=UPI00262CDF4C|nr:hypothetical protein [uncultured Eubacterium sp.]
MIVWEAVSADEYELPLAQAETLIELARILDKSYTSARKRASEQYSGRNKGFKILKIEIDDNEDC